MLVLLTLVYLAIQTRSINRQSKAETRYALVGGLIVRNDLLSILGSPGGRYFWAEEGEAAFDEGFVAFVREELASDRTGYDRSGMAKR